MRKTTVYLPDEIKAALVKVAAETGRSEAELIRAGIRLAIDSASPRQPAAGLFDSGVGDASESVDDLLAGFGRA